MKYNYEIIRFYSLIYRNNDFTFNKILNNLENRPIYQPELSTYMFYGYNNELKIIDGYINNKFIKREIYIKSLNILEKLYLNMYITFMEDSMITFIIYRIAKSFFFLKKFGYYYLRNSISISKNLNKISDLKFKFIFIYLKIIYDYSKMTKYDKDMANILFTNLNNFIIKNTSTFKKYYYLFKDIINICFKSTFITDENKNMLNDFKKKIKKKFI